MRDFSTRFGVTATFSVSGENPVSGENARRWPPIVELSALRIAQEALTNAARHSEASLVTVRLVNTPERLQLTIEDNGRGFDYDSGCQEGCFGLIGMRERAMAANGALQIRSRPNQGTQIACEFSQEDLP